MRPNLVIARGGRNSLHPRWLEGGERNWDLLLCPYEETPPVSDFPVPPATPGQKWRGVGQLLISDPIWRRYEYIWVPDDDILADAGQISHFFDLCRRFNAALAQPALTEDSYFSFAMTMRNRAFFARATNFVEIMAPCFRRDFLEQSLPTIAAANTGWGWGLSYAWAKQLDNQGIYIFDAAPMRHTRPVGKLRSKYDQAVAIDEWGRMLEAYGTGPIKQSLFGCDEAGNRIEMSNGRFLAAYIAGYDYLLEQDAELLMRIARDQLKPGWPWYEPRYQRRRRRRARRFWWRQLLRRMIGRPMP